MRSEVAGRTPGDRGWPMQGPLPSGAEDADDPSLNCLGRVAVPKRSNLDPDPDGIDPGRFQCERDGGVVCSSRCDASAQGVLLGVDHLDFHLVQCTYGG